jgi:hypothetical protein
MVSMVLFHGYGLLEQALDAMKVLSLTLRTEGKGVTRLPCPCSTSDPMHVGFWLRRNLIIDDM